MNVILKFVIAYQRFIANLIFAKLKRKRFTSWNENEIFNAENPSRNTYFNVLFSGMMSCFILVSIFGMFTGEDYISNIVFLILGIIGLRQFLWITRGIEKIKIDGKNLYLTKEGSFLKKNTTYELKKISNVRAKIIKNEEEESEIKKHIQDMRKTLFENHRIFFGFATGEIFFKYGYETISLFSNINDSEKKLVVSEIEKRLN